MQYTSFKIYNLYHTTINFNLKSHISVSWNCTIIVIYIKIIFVVIGNYILYWNLFIKYYRWILFAMIFIENYVWYVILIIINKYNI